MAEEKKRTSQEWYEYLNQKEANEGVPRTKILDPDGWDRKNFDYSFHEEEITWEEFMMRLNVSTIKKVPPKKDKDLKTIEEHNKEEAKKYQHSSMEPTKTGIECPQCGDELVDTEVGPMNTILPTDPPKKAVKCQNCGYATSVIV